MKKPLFAGRGRRGTLRALFSHHTVSILLAQSVAGTRVEGNPRSGLGFARIAHKIVGAVAEIRSSFEGGKVVVQFLVNGLAASCQIALFALPLWLIYVTGKFIDVSQAGLFVITGYLFLAATHSGLPLWLAVLGSLLAGGAAAMASEMVLFRPLLSRSASVPVMLLTGLALYQVLVATIAMIYGNTTQMLSSTASQAWLIGPVIISLPQAFQVGAASALFGLWFWTFSNTRVGIYVRAASEDRQLFASFGLDLNAVRTWAFCVAGALVGLAACISTADTGVNPDRGMPALLDALTAVLLGGTSSPAGPVLGALVLGLLKAMVGYQFSERWEPAVTFGVLALILTIRTEGLRALDARRA